MKAFVLIATLALAGSWSVAGYAQTPQEHHPGGAPAQGQPAPQHTPPSAQSPAAAAEPMQKQMPKSPMMQAMPEQCMAMMQKMPQGCMAMMQGGMGHGGGMPQMGKPDAMPSMSPSTTASVFTKAYIDAANTMHGPMMQGVQAADPDVAYARGMIAHHQGAIDMAKVRLTYGKDEQTRKWAEDVIREQQREIVEMELWLKKIAP